jgi:CxxC motif-containing protein (DUF1111 family)
MGPGLADGVVVGEAEGNEFRTEPLWGVAATGPYLHDGRADTLDEAIRQHGGEATRARTAYAALGEGERQAVLAFLVSLGGAEARSDGLLARDAPVPAAGTLGGPGAALDGADRDRFVRGRALFDRDIPLAEGLGPLFNGDSCRACHFEPVIGGAGPAGVDVIRVGTRAADGTLYEPSTGAIAHRHALQPARPSVGSAGPGAALSPFGFERRQTPALFGSGAIDAIADRSILAHADPADEDGDGIRGRPSILPDGRVGRFGWKAQQATLLDFVVDALANEVGLTAAESRAGDLPASIAFYLSALAPPPGHSRDHAAEDDGARSFRAMGCAACHVPELETRAGQAVRLYSDLLLHDVAPPGAELVADALAGRAFRTPPLWGIADSPPYLHDGAAPTLEAAILRHAGEAERSRSAFAKAPAALRANLLAFLSSL